MEPATVTLTREGLVAQLGPARAYFGAKWGALLGKLTHVYTPKVGPVVRTRMYSYTELAGVKYIVFPRTILRVLRGLNPRVDFGPRAYAEFTLGIDLFDNQRRVVDRVLEVFTEERMNDGTAIALLNLRAGQGKTFVAAGLIAQLGLRVLYVVPKRPLILQAVRDLHACFPQDTARIGPYTHGCVGLDIICVVINSAVCRDQEFYNGFSFVIFDEVHEYVSEKRREIFKKCSAPVVLGMSATTEDRTDGLHEIIHKELAYDGVIRADELPEFTREDVHFDTIVDVIKYNGPPEYTKNIIHPSTERLFTPWIIEQFINDPYRTRLVIDKLRELYDWRGPAGETHSIYVFCEEREPLVRIAETLRGFYDIEVPELEIGHFVGGIKDSRVSELKAHARVLLATYGYAGTGVSIDRMTAILFLTPRRANMKQILARILRRGGAAGVTRRVIDIVDNKTALKNQYYSRRAAYEFYNMETRETTVQYTDL